MLRKWVREAEADPGSAFPGHGVLKLEQQEIERLRCAACQDEGGTRHPKKVAAYFARDSI